MRIFERNLWKHCISEFLKIEKTWMAPAVGWVYFVKHFLCTCMSRGESAFAIFAITRAHDCPATLPRLFWLLCFVLFFRLEGLGFWKKINAETLHTCLLIHFLKNIYISIPISWDYILEIEKESMSTCNAPTSVGTCNPPTKAWALAMHQNCLQCTNIACNAPTLQVWALVTHQQVWALPASVGACTPRRRASVCRVRDPTMPHLHV